MTNSEQIIQLGNNAYGKAATALNILRETVMGRELFDYAFKEYARRWAFKHPTPSDFFRTMEDASAVDLDWFWRGWFYGTDNVDISIEDINYYKIDSKDPAVEMPYKQTLAQQKALTITEQRNLKDIPETAVERNPALKDFYNTYNEYAFTQEDKRKFEKYKSEMGADEKQIFDSTYHFYEIKFKNIGGLVMPLILDFTFADSTKRTIKVPAEIWRRNEKEITKVFSFTKEVTQVSLDPMKETADTDIENNYFPRVAIPTKFEMFKRKSTGMSPNPMRDNPR
jgi:hypothetical protein